MRALTGMALLFTGGMITLLTIWINDLSSWVNHKDYEYLDFAKGWG
jgi:hypothetical protein